MTVHSVRYLNSIGLGYLNQPITGNIDYKLTTYSKLIVVRHPFDRLMSAYSNKFVEEGYYSKAFAKHILKEFADRVTYDSHGIMRISLNQFLFLISKYYYRGFLDRHWQSYYDLCHPCDVHYDKIIKLETLDEDISAFTRHYTDDDTGTAATFPALNMARNDDNKLAEVTRIFSKVDRGIIKALLEIYHKDFELFGYTWSHTKGAGQVN